MHLLWYCATKETQSSRDYFLWTHLWVHPFMHSYMLTCFKSLDCRVQASCLSTCSWSATQQRRSTSLATPVSTALVSVTALTTRASSSTQRPGHGDEAPRTSPVKLHCKWALATLLSSNAPTMIRSPLRPVEGSAITSQATYRLIGVMIRVKKTQWRWFSFKKKIQLRYHLSYFHWGKYL